MKYTLFIVMFFASPLLFAQSADFIFLKKKNKTIARYYTGSTIEFTTTNGVYLNADITQIKNDTLFLRQYLVQRVVTNLGVYIYDTLGSYSYKYHYNQIKYIGRDGNKKFNLSGTSASLLGGGLLLTLASGVVYVADREKFSPQLLAAGVAATGIGYLLAKVTGKGITIGKKYRLVYYEVSAAKKSANN